MKKFLRRSFGLVTILAAFVYLLSCLTPFISPVNFWPMTFLALGFPITAAVFLLFIFAWFFIHRKTSLILLIVFLCGFSNIQSCFGLRFPSSFNYKKDSSHLRVLTWNVRNFDNSVRHAEAPWSVRRQMINYLKKVNADVVLMQEFVEYANPIFYNNIQTMDSLGYRYHYATRDFSFSPSWNTTIYGSAIFSKYPLIDAGNLIYENLPVPESIAFGDIMFNGKRLRIFTTHLASMNLKTVNRIEEDPFYPKYDSFFSFKNSLVHKLIHYDSLHAQQAEQVKTLIAKSPYPVILSGDLNSVPASYVYYTVKGKNKDVFTKKGYGLGTTYSLVSPTLRIDYLFVDPAFSVKQYEAPHLKLSDHYPVVADLQLK